MRVLVTGATGFVGLGLCRRLAARGDEVVALSRSPDKDGLLANTAVRIQRGDLDDVRALARGMEGCQLVFHVAALARAAAPDPQAFHRVNVEGTRRVLELARAAGGPRVVHTSTAAVLGPSIGGPLDESAPPPRSHLTEYSRTKALAEAAVRDHLDAGHDAVIVNPTRIYGPTPLRPLPMIDQILSWLVRSAWAVLPGGAAVGNYVDIDDVVEGHLLAASHGHTGERYLLGGTDLSFPDLARALDEACGRRHLWLPMPELGAAAAAQVVGAIAALSGRPSPLPVGAVRRYYRDWAMSSEKARRELGYRPRPIREGLARTVAWLRSGPPAEEVP